MAASAPSPTKTMDMINALVSDVVAQRIDEIRDAAITRAGSLIYTGPMLAKDLDTYASMLVDYGVPPIATLDDSHISLACIVNVEQFAGVEQIDKFRPDKDRNERESLLDNLILKAVELSEVQRTWESIA